MFKAHMAAAVLALLLCGGFQAHAQDDATSRPEPADEVIESLLEDFELLRVSLIADGGVRDTSLPIIRAMRDRIDALAVQRSSDGHLMALQVQLNTWLKDDAAVDVAYQRIMDSEYASQAVGSAWLTYFKRSRDHDRVGDIYSSMLQLDPENMALRVEWSRHMVQNGFFQQAIDLLLAVEIDPAEEPRAIELVAKARFSLDEFQECLDTLDSIPAEALEADRALKASADRLREQATEYVDLWAAELEIRAAEASADDLPRVKMTTDKGTIIIELFENEAPNTVANFLELAGDKKYFTQTLFFGVVRGKHVQVGDPITRSPGAGRPGTSTPGYHIPDEHTADGARMNFAGSVGMMKLAAPNTAGCNIYIAQQAAPSRNGRYTVFGRVIEGMDVLRRLSSDDTLIDTVVLRKRDHDYDFEKIPVTQGD